MRDDFSVKTKQILAHRVGFKCSNPICRTPTSGASEESSEKHINIGVASHICAASKGGPRYDSDMSPEERSSFENGIWLCQSCSKLIDSDSVRFTELLLKIWKKTAEEISVAELSSSNPINVYEEDKKLIEFYIQCFDRPAFQHPIEQEGKMEDFRKAIEDTIIALNTGVQRTGNGDILKAFDGKSMINNKSWREKLTTIVDMLISINHRLAVAEADNVFYSNVYGIYCFNDREIAEWFDKTRSEILKILFSICEEASISNHLHFPRTRLRW